MTTMNLPEPSTDGKLAVEAAMAKRRSRRAFAEEGVSLEALGQVLWSAQGITDDSGRRRTVPSAGGVYPIELHVAVASDSIAEAGVYLYRPQEHLLEPRFEGDIRSKLVTACLGQDFLAAVPVNLLMAADVERTANRYGERAERYVDMEAGHISQNVHLQAEALDLGTVAVGAFRDEEVAAVFRLKDNLSPLYVMPLGVPLGV
jgi:SagB-type dehydrogenase family enzyme